VESDKMNEITLNHRELKQLLEIVEVMNPPNTMMLAAGTIRVSVDNSSGIGSIVKATIPVKQGDRWGEWTTNITDESSW
jgi:hypothetical protein